MELVTIIDSDGHFQCAPTDNRKDVIALLKKIEDGDYWQDLQEEAFEDVGVTRSIELYSIDEGKWKEFISSFIQKGRMEILSINGTI